MKKTAIILAIIMCIGIFTGCVANQNNEATTTTTTTSQEATSNDIVAESTTLEPTEITTANYTPITLKEALETLSDKYGENYTVRATVVEENIQYFSIDDKNSGEKFASVGVDMQTAEATETITQTQEKSTFNLNG